MIQFEENISLKPYNTFGIDVQAKEFGKFFSVQDLQESHQKLKSSELFVLGGGSNILLTKNVEKTVLLNTISYINKIEESDSEVIIEAGGGVVWHDFVLHCIDSGWFGIENLSLIPGSVGASPMQNIGAYGVEIKDVFHSLQAFHIESGELHQFNAEQCEFGYRESVFKRSLKGQYIITSVQFKLSKEPKVNTSYGIIEQQLSEMGVENPSPKNVSDAVIAIRQSKLPDPREIGNSGSFFKNPVIAKTQFEQLKQKHPNMPSYPVSDDTVKVPAGWLIDQAGWKGKTFGDFGVHKNQALVLVNYGGATGEEIYNLSTQIIQDIDSKYGIVLEREVNVF